MDTKDFWSHVGFEHAARCQKQVVIMRRKKLGKLVGNWEKYRRIRESEYAENAYLIGSFCNPSHLVVSVWKELQL